KTAKRDAGHNRDYWPFYQLETFIRYKAMQAGVAVDAVRPHYTSKTCHHCGALNERRKHAYVCTRCGHQAHADANAAQNVRDWYGLCCPVVLEAPLGGPHDPAPKRVREITAKAVM
ncbi:transposase, partial [Allochromatium humboldtianum]